MQRSYPIGHIVETSFPLHFVFRLFVPKVSWSRFFLFSSILHVAVKVIHAPAGWRCIYVNAFDIWWQESAGWISDPLLTVSSCYRPDENAFGISLALVTFDHPPKGFIEVWMYCIGSNYPSYYCHRNLYLQHCLVSDLITGWFIMACQQRTHYLT